VDGELNFKKFEKYPDWLYLLFLIFPVVLLFFRILIGKTFFWDDALYLWYPNRHFSASSLSKGVLPLWNPYLVGGMPFQADIQSAIFYPFNLFLTPFIFKGMLSSRMLQLVTVIHVYLGGIFMFLLMKKLLNHKFSAFFCSLIYVMLPQIVYRSVQPIVLESMIWLPLLFLIVVHLVEKRSWFFSFLGGIVVALNLFTGFPHFAFMNFSLVTFYVFSYVVKDIYVKRDIRGGSCLILQSISMFVIGIGLFAIQLLPSLEFTEIATRSVGWNYNLATDVSFHPLRLIGFLIPKFFGSVSPLRNEFWLRMPYYTAWELAIYFGLLPLVFAVYGLFRRRNFQVKFFAVAAILSLWFALGKYGFAYYLVYLTPFFHRFRCPARFAYIFDFSMILLAGYGLKDLLTSTIDEKLMKKITLTFLVLSFFVLLFAVGLFEGKFNDSRSFVIARKYSFISLIIIFVSVLIVFRFKEIKKLQYLPVLLLIFVFVDLFLADFGVFEGPVRPEKFFAKTEPVKFFTRESEEFYRVNTRIKNMGIVFPRSLGCIHGFYTLQGLMPLRLLNFNSLNENLNQDVRFDIYDVKYTLADKNGGAILLERKDYLPRAKLYYSYLVVKDKDKVFELLNGGEFDYRNKIILDENPSLNNPQSDVEGDATITNYSENFINLRTNSNRDAILFLSEHAYPGWKAYVDGREEKIIKAFVAFRAVSVPAGTHEVKFVFSPDSFIKGRNISVLTLILTILFLVLSFVYYNRKR
jgi:uncharacterized membrane protein YfhO